jgi:ubiquinone/menaquinone biosynthesis C-methylase UbiE
MATSAEAAADAGVDIDDLRGKVQRMYDAVARHPDDGHFHFEMGRALAERLGYAPADLDAIPGPAIESFAGVGYYFDLAALQPGESVVDLGSGSGMDTFIAARHVSATGRVIGVDMTDAQREKATTLAAAAGFGNVTFRAGFIEDIPLADGEADCIISNGVINLCPDKSRVFAEAARVLRPGGRLAMADIVTDVVLPSAIACNATLWAACIGGAAERASYRAAIEAAGLHVVGVRENGAYAFLSRSALNASREYGVRSISLIATKDTVK